jgi:segregation and condensation protein B
MQLESRLPDDPSAALAARIEALLFVSSAPLDVGRLAEALGASTGEVEAGLHELEANLSGRGLRLQRHRSKLQLTTAPELAAEVESFLQIESTARLTPAALEVLAIIAYRQPATRPMIDSIRGVNSDSSLRTLLRLGLIEETGRTEGPGRPILYATTPDFLRHFGITSLEALPPLAPEESTESVEQLDSLSAPDDTPPEASGG